MNSTHDKNIKASKTGRRRGKVRGPTITMAHGGGGKAMRDLIDDVFVSSFDNEILATLEDQARFSLKDLASEGDRLAFTTDSFVVDPLFFPGGDIGTLAVNGTVNDLAMSGAKALYLSCSVIIEEGLPVETLRRVADSMRVAAELAGVKVVTGDTKVVNRGSADKLFINTAGIGVIDSNVDIAATRARPGDVILINGYIGDHGAAVLDARGELALESTIETDCQPLNGLVRAMLDVCPDIHCLRDGTRGGVATVLNEFAEVARCCMRLNEDALLLREEVRGMCELLGLDPLYLANEGKLVAIIPAENAQQVLTAMRAHPAGKDSVVIGEVTAKPEAVVVLQTVFGGQRIVDMLTGEQLPRIC